MKFDIDFLKTNEDKPMNTIGWWRVTTEGDVEGRSTTRLGLHYGHPVDIAYKLRINVGSWSLHFEPIGWEHAERLDLRDKNTNKVQIQIGTLGKASVLKFLARSESEIEAEVQESKLYGCVEVHFKDNNP